MKYIHLIFLLFFVPDFAKASAGLSQGLEPKIKQESPAANVIAKKLPLIASEPSLAAITKAQKKNTTFLSHYFNLYIPVESLQALIAQFLNDNVYVYRKTLAQPSSGFSTCVGSGNYCSYLLKDESLAIGVWEAIYVFDIDKNSYKELTTGNLGRIVAISEIPGRKIVSNTAADSYCDISIRSGLIVWDTQREKPIKKLEIGGVSDLQPLSPETLLCAGGNGLIIHNFLTDKAVETLSKEPGFCLYKLQDGRFAVGGKKTIAFWDMATRKCLNSIATENDIDDLYQLRNGSLVGWCKYNGEIMIFDLVNNACIKTFRGYFRPPFLIARENNIQFTKEEIENFQIWHSSQNSGNFLHQSESGKRVCEVGKQIQVFLNQCGELLQPLKEESSCTIS